MTFQVSRTRGLCLAIALLMAAASVAQTVSNMGDVTETCRKAMELMGRQRYGLAQTELERALNKGRGVLSEAEIQDAEYYMLVCAYELWNPNAAALISAFVEAHPESARQNDARYLLAKCYFRNADYEKAAEAFGHYESATLSGAERDEFLFKKAYSLFMLERLDEASPLFAQLKDGSGKYAPAATYYYAHIAYADKRYATALNGFEALQSDETFAKIVPYYIMHCYHAMRSYDKVIELGAAFLPQASAKRKPEVARIVGEAYYNKKQYAEALEYMEKFVEAAPKLTRFDKYLLGYLYYENKDYDKASRVFELIVLGQDSLAQSAYYYLADAYLQQGDKQNAGRAFLQVSKMDYFPIIKEDAMLSYAKLMFELNSGPFNDAISALNMYLTAYPKSRHADEIYKCLMQAYLYSKNYKDALASLQAIAKPDAEALAAMQKVAYYRAIDLLQNQAYSEALRTFDISLQHATYDPSIAALATYWKGETAYRMNDFAMAQALFHEAILSPGIAQKEEYRVAHYSLAYSLYKQRNYLDAVSWFRKYIAFANGTPTAMLCDAYNRIGDCDFMQRSYERAIVSYQAVLNMNAASVDYAALQCGLCYGLLGQQDRKIELMDVVLSVTPASLYADYALYEKGRCYVQMQRYEQAVSVYNELLNKYRESAYYAKSLIDLGLIAVNKGNNMQALDYYKQVVSQFAGTAEARSALMGIKNIYIEMGDADGYFKYVALTNRSADVSQAAKDSMMFTIAERAYMADNCSRAIELFEGYLQEFSGGAFFVDASYYLGDCLARAGRLNEALAHLTVVLDTARSASTNSYTESALVAAAQIAFKLENYGKAAEYYARLQTIASTQSTRMDAYVGKFRSSYLNGNQPATIVDATALIGLENVPDNIMREAYFHRAKAYAIQGDTLSAMVDYAVVARDVKTAEGAEATYTRIAWEFGHGEIDKAEQDVFKFSKSGTPHQYWLAKSFIILGDVYAQRNDAFQAKATYESILDGYKVDNDGIIGEVARKMQALLRAEQQKESEQQQAVATDTLMMN